MSVMPSRLRSRKCAFYGLRVGQSVCVHGSGFGEIVAMGEGQFPSEDLVQVAIPRSQYHAPSDQIIQWTENVTVHPRHVSRSAA